MSEVVTADEVLAFWYSDAARKRWFNATPAFDGTIRERFLATWEAAARGELAGWEADPRGALALVIVLDQFPLNMFRGRARSFSTEADARAVTERALAAGYDQALRDEEKAFLYMPLMHSESLSDQERSVALYEAAGLKDNLKWARHHCELIRRFGRFPHRNAPLGRDETPAERAYLESDEAFRG